jgi:hypothetical protein
LLMWAKGDGQVLVSLNIANIQKTPTQVNG